MRLSTRLFLLAAPAVAASSLFPTSTVFSSTPTTHVATARSIYGRSDDSCLANTHRCPDSNEFGSSQKVLCCLIGEVCGYDQGNNPSCCPAGAVCTGLAPSARSSGSNTLATVLENPYFPFPVLSTKYIDADACTDAVSSCSAEYSTCVAQLGGAGEWSGAVVTVDGSLITPSMALGATATSICSSLSALACYGMSNSQCQTTGTLQNGIVIGNGGGVAAKAPLRTVMAIGVLCFFALA